MSEENIVLIADPRVLAITIQESTEPMIDIIDQTKIQIGPSPEIPNNTDYTKMRKTIYEKLLQAQDLLPEGIFFCLYEGYRSLSLQKKLFDARHEMIQESHPNWTPEQHFNETIKMVSPVKNLDGSVNIPPHSTGAAVDVYLINADGEALEMGIHPKDWIQDEENLVSITHSKHISPEAQKNRDIMSKVLSEVGMVNYPTEYWHWSYGDRYWAYQKNEATAIYDTVE